MAGVQLQEQVKRSSWEPRHEWEARLRFVEDHVDAYGLEKATNFSFVWANMRFLGCRYPARTEQLVAHYPYPTPPRGTPVPARVQSGGTVIPRARESLESESESENSDSFEEEEIDLGEGGGIDFEGEEEEEEEGQSSLSSDASLNDEDPVPTAKKLRSNDATPPTDPSLSAQVSALISSIRKTQESGPTRASDAPLLLKYSWATTLPGKIKVSGEEEETVSGVTITPILKSISTEACMCDKCTGWNETQHPTTALGNILQQYTSKARNLGYKIKAEREYSPDQQTTMYKCMLMVGNDVAAEKTYRKASRIRLSKQVLKMINAYQEKYNRPICPLTLPPSKQRVKRKRKRATTGQQ